MFDWRSIDLATLKDENHHLYFEYSQYPYIQMYAKIDSEPTLQEGFYHVENQVENPFSNGEYTIKHI